MHEPLCKQVRHPLEPHPHDVDVNALLCIAVVTTFPSLVIATPRSTGRGIDPSTTRIERNVVTLCSGEDKLTREDSKKASRCTRTHS
jgi:methylglyoxal synthase